MEREHGPASPSTGRLARAMTWAAAGNAVSQLLWFASLIVLGALLPPASFGTVALGMLITSAAIRLMEAGTRGSIVLRPRLVRAELRRDLLLNVANAVAITAAIALLAGSIVDTFGEGGRADVLRVLSASVVLYAFAIVPLAVLEKRLEFKRRAGVQAGSMAVASVLAVALGAAGLGVWALVVRQLVFYGLQAVLAWALAHGMMPPAEPGPRARTQRVRRQAARAFFVFALTDYVVFNADYLIVGGFTNAEQLGLYSLAFAIAFAPTRQLSSQIGMVLFPAAAMTDPEALRGRTLVGVRLSAAFMLPVIPAAIVLAPVLIPGVLGEEWRGMVLPFQLLIVVGIAHGIVNVLGETLAGAGHMGFRAAVNVPWAVGMLVALVVLVDAEGIAGAAWAHLGLYGPVVAVYAWWGGRRIGVAPRRLVAAVGPATVALLVQGAVTAAAAWAAWSAGAAEDAARAIGALAGLAAAAALLARLEADVLRRGRRFMAAALGRA